MSKNSHNYPNTKIRNGYCKANFCYKPIEPVHGALCCTCYGYQDKYIPVNKNTDCICNDTSDIYGRMKQFKKTYDINKIN